MATKRGPTVIGRSNFYFTMEEEDEAADLPMVDEQGGEETQENGASGRQGKETRERGKSKQPGGQQWSRRNEAED